MLQNLNIEFIIILYNPLIFAQESESEIYLWLFTYILPTKEVHSMATLLGMPILLIRAI